jgi:hypothetical protein
VSPARSELVRLAARLIVEEGLEGEAADALGREYYVRGAAPGAGYRNGYRTGRLKTAEGMIEYAAPQISDRAVPFRSRLREIIREGIDGRPWREGRSRASVRMRVSCPSGCSFVRRSSARLGRQ